MTLQIQTYNVAMGLYDREYGRYDDYGQRPGVHLSAPRTMTMKVILFTAGVYLLQLMFGLSGWPNQYFSLESNWYQQPWKVYQLLTYGFLHSQLGLQHILFNMYGLWLFGRDIEQRYGSREFLTFYLTAIVVAGLVWSLSTLATGQPSSGLIGASGGVVAVTILFAFHFPHRTLLLMFLFPVPMWVLGCIIVISDAYGAAYHRDVSNVAFFAHLAGAAFAFAYYRSGWRLSRWLPENVSMPSVKRRAKLRIHDPGELEQTNSDTDDAVDDILRKIKEQGQDSLTWRERRILEKASREYQKKR